MARFDHLEIGPDSDEPARPATAGAAHSAGPLINDERVSLKRADHHRRRGEYETALRFYSRALELDKSLVLGWVGQVQMLVQLDEAREADLWSRKALEIFPGNGELLAARGQALCRIGDTKQAGAACDGALAAQGKSAFRWLARGEWMLATRQNMEEHCFAKAQEVDGDWLVTLEAALIYRYYKFPSRGLARARQATESAPDQYYAWYVRGCVEADLAMTQPATESFEHCLQLCPRHADADNQLRQLGSGWSWGNLIRKLFTR